MSNQLVIDPGLYSCGWAVFSMQSNNPFPQKAGLVVARHSMREENILLRSNYIGGELAQIAQENGCHTALVEYPMNFKGAKGLAANASGDVISLAACVGAIAGNLHQIGVDCSPVRVIDWKGQLPKEVVIKRIRKILGPEMCQRLRLDKDAWDAVGIGLHYRGYFE